MGVMEKERRDEERRKLIIDTKITQIYTFIANRGVEISPPHIFITEITSKYTKRSLINTISLKISTNSGFQQFCRVGDLQNDGTTQS